MYLAKAVQSGDGRLFDTAYQFCKNDVIITSLISFFFVKNKLIL